MSLALGLVLAVAAQTPPRPYQRAAIDPMLPEALRPAVELAAAAELDPKRGPGNAVEVLRKAQAEFGADERLVLALRLREAGVVLRQRYLGEARFELPLRYEQVISTFSRLDLMEPGFRAWFDRSLENHPEARAAIAATRRTIPVAFLVRGAGLDRKKAAEAFRRAFAAVGVDLKVVPAKKARFVLKLATENPKRPVPGQRAVRVRLGIEGIEDGKIAWEHALFRTEAAAETETAIGAGLNWLSRIGGRDMFVHWLADVAFPTLRPREGDGHGHGHAGHGH